MMSFSSMAKSCLLMSISALTAASAFANDNAFKVAAVAIASLVVCVVIIRGVPFPGSVENILLFL